MIKISNIKSIVTWDIDHKKVIHIDNQSIYLKDKNGSTEHGQFNLFVTLI